jgi:type IV pilus assembly protein PilE
MKPRSLHSRIHALRYQKGVTLIELLLVMVIIAILGGIAVPAYKSYVVKTNRGAAKACMAEYAQFMERYYTTNLRYDTASPGNLGCASDANLNIAYSFSVSVNVNSPRLYTVTATPVNAQNSRDTQCGTLTLDQAGGKTKSGSAALSTCW